MMVKRFCNTYQLIISIIAVMLLCFSGALSAKTYNAITVKKTAGSNGENILLGDIATISGNIGFIDTTETIVIGRTPQPGRVRQLKKGQIEIRLKQHGINLKQIAFSCPRTITVNARCQELNKTMIEQMVRRHIRSSMPWKQELVTVHEITAESVKLPEGNIETEFIDARSEDFLGRYGAKLSFKVNGKQIKIQRVSALINVIAPVVVTTHYLERRTIVSEHDVKIEARDITYLSRNVLHDVSALVGKRLRANLNAGSVVKSEQLEDAPIVKKGDRLTLYVESEVFKITTPGEALESGALGDIIKVSNLSSNIKIYGFVRSSQAVEVKY